MRVKIDPKVLEIVRYNQRADQDGTPHPHAHVFAPIEAELLRLEKLANTAQVGLPPAEGAEKKKEMEKLDSTNLDAFSFKNGVLRVKFTNGSIYEYYGVPLGIAEGLRTANSPGGFLNTHVKGSFKYKLIDD